MQETSTSPATILQFRQDIEVQFRIQRVNGFGNSDATA